MRLESVQVYPYHVKAGYQQRGKRYDRWIYAACECVDPADADAHHTQEEPDRQCPRVAHEYLFVSLGVAEYIVDIEGHKRAECRDGKGGEYIQPRTEEDEGVEGTGYRAEPGGESVDTVNEVYGIDYEYHQQDCECHCNPYWHFSYSEKTMEIVEKQSPRYYEHSRNRLHDELRLIPDADKVVRHAGEVHQYRSRSHEAYGADIDEQQRAHSLVGAHRAEAVKKELCKYDGREERDASEAWHFGLVDFARVRLVKKILSECNEQYLGDDDTREEYHA